jgi:hypothetical protein
MIAPFKWRLGQFAFDGQPDLYGIKTQNTGSVQVEVHVAAASSNYGSFLLHTAPLFSVADAPYFADWELNEFYLDGQSDLYGIKTRNTGSGHIEIHIAGLATTMDRSCCIPARRIPSETRSILPGGL